MSFASVENYCLVFCGYYHGELLDRTHGGLLSSGNCWCLQFLGRSVSTRRFHGVSVHKRPLSTATAATKSGRPQSTLGTRLERRKRGYQGFFARKKPASPTSATLGQLPTWFLGRYLTKGFVLLPGLRGLVGEKRGRCEDGMQ